MTPQKPVFNNPIPTGNQIIYLGGTVGSNISNISHFNKVLNHANGKLKLIYAVFRLYK